MEKRGQATDRHGRVWEARVLSQEEAEEEDFRFWYEEMTPEERVRAVEECLLSSLRARESMKSRDCKESVESSDASDGHPDQGSQEARALVQGGRVELEASHSRW